MIELGATVFYRSPAKQGQLVGDDWPAIVYKLWPNEPTFLGLMVLYDGTPSRYGKVPYSEMPKENHWSPRYGEKLN